MITILFADDYKLNKVVTLVYIMTEINNRILELHNNFILCFLCRINEDNLQRHEDQDV